MNSKLVNTHLTRPKGPPGDVVDTPRTTTVHVPAPARKRQCKFGLCEARRREKVPKNRRSHRTLLELVIIQLLVRLVGTTPQDQGL